MPLEGFSENNGYGFLRDLVQICHVFHHHKPAVKSDMYAQPSAYEESGPMEKKDHRKYCGMPQPNMERIPQPTRATHHPLGWSGTSP